MLSERIDSEFKQAMKEKNSVKVSTLSLLRSSMKYVMIEKKTNHIDDADVIVTIKKQIKQRQDSIAQYEQGGRQDLADKESAELAVLISFLPAELPPAEIEQIIAGIIRDTGAQGMKDMGRVMKEAQARLSSRADNRMISEVVKKVLGQL